MKTDADEIVRRHEELTAEKQVFMSHWQEIAEYMIPRKASIITKSTPGEKRTSKVYDGTAIRALRILANGLYGHMTSPSAPWFDITVRDPRIKAVPGVKEWLREVTQTLLQALQASNFHMTSHEVYTDLGAFGTAPVFISKGDKTYLNFQAVPVSQVTIAEDHNGRVDTVMRCFEMTGRQIQQKFKNLPEKIAKEAKERPDKVREVIHAVFPREDADPQKKDAKSKPVAAVYLDKQLKEILEEGGYNQMAYCVPRWEKDTGEVFGRSPGMDALPDTKMLNLMKKDYIRAIQKMIDPPLLVSDEMKMRSMSTRAGSIIYYRSSSGTEPKSLQMGGEYQIAVDYEARIAEGIREAFYADLFMLLAQKPQGAMTATEVLERVEEKLVLLGPTMGRLQQELYDPMLTRCFWILYEEKAFPQVPQALMGTNLQIEYISRLALAMRKYETDAMRNTIEMVSPLAQIDQAVLDNFDLDQMARGSAERFGIPVEWMRPPDKVRIIRKSRAEAQAAAMAQAQKEKEQMMQADIASKALPAMNQDIGPDSMTAKAMGIAQAQGAVQ